MKPAPFDYLRADDEAEALEALAEAGDDARLLAGGQTLMPMLNMRLVEPAVLIDISRLPGRAEISDDGARVEVGAAVTQARLEAWPALRVRAPLLAQALPLLGHVQTRSRGTVCGSIAFADPSAELPLCLATLGGEAVLRSRAGARALAAREFQTGMLSTACREDEMVAAVRFPTAEPGAGYAFTEFARRHGDFAIVAVAAVARATGITIGVGGAAEQPVVRDWPALDGSALDDALNELAWSLDAADDAQASARYRRELVRGLGERTVQAAEDARP
ncbi:MAG: FAD binding domain-containing protein [Rhodospirillales bacterium]|nr:FAD binding domain-containing protein [Rhodospirillales bacterium]MDE0379058.1 FAD binding domain-containing protein [Rhodospirillales bacterium]